jgi:tripartite-type tricarboxylate transporter receptor subunit TctC
LFPEVRTASEAGMPGLEFAVWLALLAPKGTDPALLARLQAAGAEALAAPAVANALRERGYVVRQTTVAQARTYLRLEYEQWQRAAVRRAKRSSVRDMVAGLHPPLPGLR